jgi:tetratricopeptide (TPR) repeat protein
LALEQIAAKPYRALVLTYEKFLAFWNGVEQFDNYDVKFIEDNFSTLLSLPLIPFWPLTGLAAFGVVGAFSYKNRAGIVIFLFALAYMFSVLPFYVTDRYRLPVVVFLFPLAGTAIPYVRRLIIDRRFRDLFIGSILAMSFVWLGLRDPSHRQDLRAFNWGTLAMLYSDIEQDDKAIEAFNRAISISPLEAGASAYVRASYAYERMGQIEKARAVLENASQLFPHNGIVLYNLARFLAARGGLKDAMPLFERASQLSPHYLLNYYALAKGYRALGQNDKAILFLQKGLQIDKNDKLLNEIAREILPQTGGR